MVGYIYLTHELEFINSNKPIYKLELFKEKRKFDGYYTNNELKLMTQVHNYDTLGKLIHVFNENFINKNVYGREYYEGDCYLMIKEICKFISTYKKKSVDSDIIELEKKFKIFRDFFSCNILDNIIDDVYPLYNKFNILVLNDSDLQHTQEKTIDIKNWYREIKHRYGNPKTKKITCTDYYKFITINNAIVKIYDTIYQYEVLRKTLDITNKKYIRIVIPEAVKLKLYI